ncbi:hypothetical protein [Streptomyces sp. NPDC001744]|uniref:hypothetical protein n=1 Tax=Streptomyces sp. NPDC001744 TaxID=3364606 RepID=UPI0036CE953B
MFELPRIYYFCKARIEEEFHRTSVPLGSRLLGRLEEAVHTLRVGFPVRPGGISYHEADRRVCAIADRYRDHPDYPSLWRPYDPPEPPEAAR